MDPLDPIIPEEGPGIVMTYSGCMFSKKTTHLAMRYWQDSYRLNLIGFRNKQDNRYGVDGIATHNLLTIPNSIVVSDSKSIWKEYNRIKSEHEQEGKRLHEVLIDEAMLYDEGLVEIVLAMRGEGTSITLAFLDRDSRNEPFHFMGDEKQRHVGELLAIADYDFKFTTRCHEPTCREPATRTMKLVETGKVVHIGGAKDYTAACPRHWVYRV